MKKTLLSALCALVLSLPTLASVNRPFFGLTTKFEGFFSEKTIIARKETAMMMVASTQMIPVSSLPKMKLK